MPRKISLKTFLFQMFSIKSHLQCTFDNNLSVTPVFIRQIFRIPEDAPLCTPPPPQSCEGGGREVDLFIL
jgi:hypothetical protein